MSRRIGGLEVRRGRGPCAPRRRRRRRVAAETRSAADAPSPPSTAPQKQALALYRGVLRAARAKPDAAALAALGRAEFERHRGVDRRDFARVEALLRRGQRQLSMLSAADVTGIAWRRPGGAVDPQAAAHTTPDV
jgi:succinate dehydrogenase assembly factor 1